jgi:NTE family protein
VSGAVRGATGTLPHRRARHRSFALVLAGGGARGLSHVGVLRALHHYGYAPSAIVGVSMGAVVGTTYALNARWYPELLSMDTTGFPAPLEDRSGGFLGRLRSLRAYQRAIWSMLRGWGIGAPVVSDGRALLSRLTLDLDLEDGRIPIVVVATDLISGDRVILRRGSAADAAYASAALAGIVPPLAQGAALLADGGYADLVPVDVARDLGPALVVAVDPSPAQTVDAIGTGAQALVRALEICHRQHAHARFASADLVLTPRFARSIDTLDFTALRSCVAAGAHAVRSSLPGLRRLLDSAAGASATVGSARDPVATCRQ